MERICDNFYSGHDSGCFFLGVSMVDLTQTALFSCLISSRSFSSHTHAGRERDAMPIDKTGSLKTLHSSNIDGFRRSVSAHSVFHPTSIFFGEGSLSRCCGDASPPSPPQPSPSTVFHPLNPLSRLCTVFPARYCSPKSLIT